MPALTKDLLVKAVDEETGLAGKQTDELVETLIELIMGSLSLGDNVLINGFGKFSIREKKERKGRNPATGDSLMLKPRRVVTFHCSGKLREKLNRP